MTDQKPEHLADQGSSPMISNGMYDKLKQSAQLLLPAAGALYFTLAQIWHWANAEQVVGSIAAVNVFVGVLVTIFGIAYNKSDAKYDGVMEITETDDKKTMALSLNSDPDEFEKLKQVTFKVDRK